MTDPNQPTLTRAERRRAAEAAARDQARRRSRSMVLAAGAVVALLLVIAGAWWLSARGGGTDVGDATPAASDPALRQPTMLLQLRNADSVAVSNGLLAVGGPSDKGTMVLIPSTLVLDAPTGGTLPLGEIARLPDADASATALSDLLGVRVDGTFAMDTVAFAGLVDAVGGVTAQVDADVIGAAPDGTRAVLVPAGTRLLDGLSAARFATYRAPGETEQARLARFQQVFRLVAAKLPAEPELIDPILTSLGSLARSTVPTTTVAQFLARFREQVVAERVDYPSLPVVKLETGGEQTSFGADLEADAALVALHLPDAARVAGPNNKVRVLVQNGRLVPGLGAGARELLVDAGFTYVYGGNASNVVRGTSEVVIPDQTPESVQWGTDIAAALGLPASDIRVATEGQSIADVIVVLADDFTVPAK
jgi:anionic cell wall polymer biosynthesis LytR-Cps2A-Psr (LCP) family protein